MNQCNLFLDKVMIISLLDFIKLDESNYNLKDYVIISFKDEIHDHLDILDKYDYIEIEFDDIKSCELGKENQIFTFGKQIADYINKAIRNNKKIICQCVYGNSRSAGCAAAILEYLYHKGSLIINNPNYKYNEIVYKCILKELIND